MNRKIVIIGGGISGLTAGIYARKAGYDAEIYEQHTVAGGECTGWNRQGYHIDNCIHWMMGTTPGSGLYQIWETTGAVGNGVGIRRSDSMYTSELGGKQITLWQDIGRTEKELLALSPADSREIRKLMKFCRIAEKVQIPSSIPPEQTGALEGVKMAFTMGPALRIFREYAGMDTTDLMNRFSHPLIRCILSDFCTKESLAGSFPMAYGNFTGGDGGIPEGGSLAMAQRMRKTFEALGGRFFTGNRVRKIVLEKAVCKEAAILPGYGKSGGHMPRYHASGIQTEGGKEVRCDYVIPACDMSVTFGTLLPKRYMPALLTEIFEKRDAYPVYNSFQTAFALDSPDNLIGPEIILDCSDISFSPAIGKRLTVKAYDYEPGFAPEGRQLIQTMMGGPEQLYEEWKRLYQKPAAYQAKKMELAGKIQDVLERRFPACAGKLSLLDAWTPMTYERYMSAFKGFYQSFTITKKSVKQPWPPAFCEDIDNVVLAGQWLNPPGGLPGAAIAGKFAIQRVQKLDAK